MEDLPDLLTGRGSHGCGHYVNNDNKMVSSFIYDLMSHVCIHVRYYWLLEDSQASAVLSQLKFMLLDQALG